MKETLEKWFSNPSFSYYQCRKMRHCEVETRRDFSIGNRTKECQLETREINGIFFSHKNYHIVFFNLCLQNFYDVDHPEC